MGREVWGTFSVRDHCRSYAFVADVLIYDRLVIPYPADRKERTRWRAPNSDNPEECWEPERLDALLAKLGSQREEGHEGAKLAWLVDWDEHKWTYERSRAEAADIVNDDFHMTRRILSMDDEIPGVVEAVAAYPSAEACRADRGLRSPGPDAVSQGELCAVLARPLLVPDTPDEVQALEEAISLANDPAYRKARAAYHQWIRTLLEPARARELQSLNRATINECASQLARLIEDEKRIVGGHKRSKRWTAVKQAFTVTRFGLALAAVPVELASQLLGFVADRLSERQPGDVDRPPLTGASMFVEAERAAVIQGWALQ